MYLEFLEFRIFRFLTTNLQNKDGLTP